MRWERAGEFRWSLSRGNLLEYIRKCVSDIVMSTNKDVLVVYNYNSSHESEFLSAKHHPAKATELQCESFRKKVVNT